MFTVSKVRKHTVCFPKCHSFILVKLLGQHFYNLLNCFKPILKMQLAISILKLNSCHGIPTDIPSSKWHILAN